MWFISWELALFPVPELFEKFHRHADGGRRCSRRNVGKVIQRRRTAAAWTSNLGVDSHCIFVYTVYTVIVEVDFILSQADGRPMYLQIMDQVQQQVAVGDWRPGTRLPSIRETISVLRPRRPSSRSARNNLSVPTAFQPGR